MSLLKGVYGAWQQTPKTELLKVPSMTGLKKENLTLIAWISNEHLCLFFRAPSGWHPREEGQDRRQHQE